MRTVSKKVLSLLLVAVLVLSAIPFAAFADDNKCPTHTDVTLQKHDEVSATCTKAGTKEYYTCSDADCADKKYVISEDGQAVEAQAEALVISALGHDLERHAAVAAKCATGEPGTEAYDMCKREACGAMFAVDGQGNTADAITAPIPVPAVHIDANNDGTCDVCKTSIKCTITFEIQRVYANGTVEVQSVPLSPSTKAVKQGEKMGDPVVAPECPRGYAYDRLNGSVWTMVKKNDADVTNGGSYSKDNVVTVDMKTVTYRAVQREQTVNLTVAFRKGNTEYTYCTIPNIPYSKTIDGNKNAISVYDYIGKYDKTGKYQGETGFAGSILDKFVADFASKSITTNNGGIVDVTGFTWTNDQKFLSATTNNPINDGALKLNINLGIANPDVKVYANLKEQTSFEITFSPMSPYGSTASVQGSFGKKTVTLNSVLSGLPTPTCTGYVFMGWYDEPMKGDMSYANGIVTLDGQNAGAKHYVNGTQYTTRSNITLYPYWIKEVDAWVVVHNNKDGNVSSMAKIQGVKPTDSIAKTTVLANVQGYTANNFIGPIKSDSATGFNNWTAAPMGASVATNATDSIYFHIYSPSAKAVSVTPGANSGANGSYSGGSGSSAAVDPSNPKTGDAQRTELNVAAITLAVATVALTVMTSVMFIRRKSEI